MLNETGLLRDLVSIYSPSGEERQVAEYLRDVMSAAGMTARIDEVGNVIGEKGSGARTVVLLGHIDTVPGFIPVRLDGDTLYGRGAVDAKGPMATFVAAAVAAELRDLRLVVIGAVEEEAASSRGARAIVDNYRPDLAVIGEPSGWDGITLGYKGRVWLNYRLRQAGSHSAGPHTAAPEIAVDFWNSISQYAEQFNQNKRAFDTLDPSLRQFNTTSDGFYDEVAALISLRIPLGFDVESFKQTATELAAGADFTFSNEDAPFRSGKQNDLVRAFLASIREHGGEPRFKVKTGTSDMNVVGPVWQCPIVAYGPGDSKLDHTPNEHISLNEYRKAIAILTTVLQTL